MMREQIVALLQEQPCWVTFTKVDGTTRTLHCTLVEDQLPVKKEETRHKEESLEVIPVFDLDAGAWKSFRVDSLKSIRTFEVASRDPEVVLSGVIDAEGVVNK